MTTVAERVSLDRIDRRARQAHPGRAALTVIAAVLFGLGWFAYKTLVAAWFAVAWCGSAVAEGWISAKSQRRAGAP